MDVQAAAWGRLWCLMPLSFLCYLGCRIAPRLVFFVAQGSRGAGRVQAMPCCLGLCVTWGLWEKMKLSLAVMVLLPGLCPSQSMLAVFPSLHQKATVTPPSMELPPG